MIYDHWNKAELGKGAKKIQNVNFFQIGVFFLHPSLSKIVATPQ